MNVNHIIRSIAAAEINVSKLNEKIEFPVNGLSHLLNNLINFEESYYLHIGIEDGNLFIPALFKNKPKAAYALDLWRSKDLKKMFIHNCCWFLEAIKYESIDGDYFIQDTNIFSNKINFFFYNGIISNKCPLKYYYDVLQDEFVFMTSNFNVFQNQITSSIKELDFKILHSYKKTEWKNGFYLWLLKK